MAPYTLTSSISSNKPLKLQINIRQKIITRFKKYIYIHSQERDTKPSRIKTKKSKLKPYTTTAKQTGLQNTKSTTTTNLYWQIQAHSNWQWWRTSGGSAQVNNLSVRQYDQHGGSSLIWRGSHLHVRTLLHLFRTSLLSLIFQTKMRLYSLNILYGRGLLVTHIHTLASTRVDWGQHNG